MPPELFLAYRCSAVRLSSPTLAKPLISSPYLVALAQPDRAADRFFWVGNWDGSPHDQTRCYVPLGAKTRSTAG